MDLNKLLILANQLLRSGKVNEAEIKFREILNSDPKNLHVLNNLGNICLKKKNFSEGIVYYEKCLKFDENFYLALNNKGTCHQYLKQYTTALDCFKKVLKLNPNLTEVYFNIGNCLLELLKYEEAISNYEKIIKKKPDHISAILNKGLCFEKLEKYEIAIELYNKVIEINKNYFKAHLQKGVCLKELGSFENAIKSYKKAIEVESNIPHLNNIAKYNLGCMQLLIGNFKDGWENYEYRKKVKLEFAKSMEWKGEKDLRNKCIFVYYEQGLGDYIQYSRYLPMLKNLGTKILLNPPNKLLPFIKSMNFEFESININKKNQLYFDYHCPIESLPFAFKTSVANIPNSAPYIKINSIKKNFWKKNINQNKKNIGIKWTGNKNYYSYDKHRSVNLNQLKSLFDLPFNFHSLEINYSVEDDLFKKNIKNLICYDKDLMGLENTAGLIENMDLIISVDTSIAHLSGALNKSTWVMLPKIPDFRWLIDRQDSPWYPSVKLYRQHKIGNWDQVIENIREDLI